MSNSYKKPIIIEQLAEIYLQPGTLTPDKFFQVVPMLQKRGLTRVEFLNIGQVTVGAVQGPAQQTPVPRVRCWDPGNQKLAQLGPDLMVVNLIGNYPGWETFQSLFEIAIASLDEANIKTKISLSFKTVDRFEVMKNGYTIEQYINCGGPQIPGSLKGSKHALDIILGHGNLLIDQFNRQFKLRVSHKRETMEFLVESSFQNLLQPAEDIDVALEKLHEESNKYFESWITVKTREEIMGGVK